VTRLVFGGSLFFVGRRRDFFSPKIFQVHTAASDVRGVGPAQGQSQRPKHAPTMGADMSEASTERLIKGKINSSRTGWNIQSN